MKLTKKEIKNKYFDRIYEEAPMVECGCGCGELIKSKDKYGRDKIFISGHNNRKYSDPTQYKKEWSHRNRKKLYKNKTMRIHKQKKLLIENAGGKCSLCGLPFDGECTSIFDFHHKDPNIKLFNVNNGSLNRYGIKKVNKEAEKCELLCAVCHRLIHWEWVDNNTASSK